MIPKEKFFIPIKNDCIFQVYKFHDDYDGLLGNNILYQNDTILNTKTKTLSINNFTVPLYYSREDEQRYEQEINQFNLLDYHEINHNEIIDPQRLEHLNSEEYKELQKLLHANKEVFYKKGQDLTFTNHVKHSITTSNDEPIFTRIYRYPEIHKKEVDRQINELLEQKIIQPSSSPYNAPIWVVPKKEDKEGNKEWRIVIDYRKLNNITKEDKYPIPLIDDILDKLGKANYFSTLDLTKGFHQIEIAKEDREKTAFSTLTGHYEWLRMPFGLKNAPATFQRMMNEVLKEYIGKICFVYLDDVIIFSTSLQEHMNSLDKILKTLHSVNLKVSLNKCDFLKKYSEFLGHIVTPDGIKPNPSKIATIQKFPIPKTVKEIQSFLGLTGYYRKFILDYAKIIKPLTKCLKKDAIINTSDKEYIEAVNKLKIAMSDDLINRHPDFSKPFILTTDASNFAIGAVLSQSHGPLCFASRTLNVHECNYSTIEKELLAIVWATKQFRHYLYGRHFKILTDHRPLVWLHNLKEPNSKLQRWKIKLEEFDFKIEYLQGKENKVADALSRVKIPEINNAELISTKHSAESSSHNLIYITEQPINYFKNQIILEIGEKESDKLTYPHKNKRIHKIKRNFSELDFKNILLELNLEKSNALLTDDKTFNLFQEYWKINNKSRIKIFRAFTLVKDIQNIDDLNDQIHKKHIEFNHIGIEKLYLELKREIYYPNMRKEITKYTNNCETCNLKIERNPIKIPYEKTPTPSESHKHYHIDIWILPKHVRYLTCIDKFSKFAAIEELRSKNQTDVARALQKIFTYLPVPEKLTLDNDPTFKTYTVEQIFKERKIETHFCTPYRHTGNSDIERLHSTLNEHIRIFDKNIFHKDSPIKALEIYNKTIHLTTKEKPIDVHLGKTENKVIFDRIEKVKEKINSKKNSNRTNVQINPNYTKVNDPAQFNKLKTKHKKVKVLEIKNKKVTIQPNREKQTLHKDQFLKLKKYVSQNTNKDPIINNISNSTNDSLSIDRNK